MAYSLSNQLHLLLLLLFLSPHSLSQLKIHEYYPVCISLFIVAHPIQNCYNLNIIISYLNRAILTFPNCFLTSTSPPRSQSNNRLNYNSILLNYKLLNCGKFTLINILIPFVPILFPFNLNIHNIAWI